MKKVKWGVIGAGGIADRRTIPGMMLAKNAELVAVMEVNMGLAEKIRSKYNAKRAYDSEAALLADPEVEAVYIASPVNCHKEQALKAAKAKKHLLMEKPLALTSGDALEIAEACRNEGILCAAGFMMRYHAYHQKMREIIKSGKLGQIVSCRGQLSCWYPDIEGAWRQKKALGGGGALMDMGIHCIDLIQYITGLKAVKVGALTATNTFKYEVDDSSSTILQLENGAFCYVDANFNIPDAAVKGRLEIYGTKGSLLAEGTISQVEGGKLDVMLSDDSAGYDAQQDRGEVKPCEVRVDFGNMYTKEIESFSESVLSGKALDVPAEEALQAQRIVEAAYESSQTGCFVKL
ncbi:MAG: Gfo/Idh/MocA family oxidoreductase [Ruminiclostridium sp.]|nr:Gfo/Idh/MocA family oxidoreductase [Ruminiclostridium sp.]